MERIHSNSFFISIAAIINAMPNISPTRLLVPKMRTIAQMITNIHALLFSLNLVESRYNTTAIIM